MSERGKHSTGCHPLYKCSTGPHNALQVIFLHYKTGVTTPQQVEWPLTSQKSSEMIHNVEVKKKL